MRHVRKALAKSLVVRADQRIRPLQVDVIAQDHQRALVEIAVDAAGGVGKNHGANSHAREHAHRKNHVLQRVAFVEMHAALHRGNAEFAAVSPITMPPGVADRPSNAGKFGMRRVVNARRVSQFVRKAPEAAAEHHADARAKLGARERINFAARSTRA